MNLFSNIILNKLLRANLITEQDQALYLYGINGFLFLTMNLLTTFLLGYLTNHFIEMLVFLIFFIPLRSYAGGFHTKKKIICYCFSNLILATIVYIPTIAISKSNYGNFHT